MIKKVYISTTDVLIVYVSYKNKNYFIRFPFTSLSSERIRNNQQLTEMLYQHGIHFVPRPLNVEHKPSFPYYVEEGIVAFNVEQQYKKFSDSYQANNF